MAQLHLGVTQGHKEEAAGLRHPKGYNGSVSFCLDYEARACCSSTRNRFLLILSKRLRRARNWFSLSPHHSVFENNGRWGMREFMLSSNCHFTWDASEKMYPESPLGLTLFCKSELTLLVQRSGGQWEVMGSVLAEWNNCTIKRNCKI